MNRNILLIILVFLFAGAIAFAADPSSLVGKWKYNEKESDNAKDKMQQAMKNSGGGWGGHHSGGWSGGSGGGWGGHDRGGDHSRGGGSTFEPAKTLTIAFQSPEFKITDDKGQDRTYFTDGREVKQDFGDGRKATVTTNWAQDSLVVDSKSDNGRNSETTYFLSADGTKLLIKTEMKPMNSD
ncbi:MAG: hypothetical protein C5B54_08370, partial [Acidobacteria bacterium]